MPYESKRDRVWIEVIETLLERPDASITPAYIADRHDVSEQTARDCLKIMSGRGLVSEDRLKDGRVRFIPNGVLAAAHE